MSARSERRARRAGNAPVAGAARPRRTGLPAPAALLAFLAAAVLLLPMLRPSLAQTPATDGYASIVAAAIGRNWLYPVADSPGAGDVDGRVERARDPAIPAAFDQFIRASFLSQDMATLDPAIWRYDGRRLEIDPRAHLISGAYEASSGWRGSLLYADRQVEQQLVDERGTAVAWLAAARVGAPRTVRRITLTENAATTAPQPTFAEEIAFVAAIDGAPTAVATVRRIGNHTLLRVARRDRAGVSVTVGNDEAAPRGAFQIGWRLLETGDTLSFTWPGGTRRFQFVQNQPAISQARGDALRVRDAALSTFAKSVESAAGSGSYSIQTSLDSRAQLAAQRLLVDQSLTLYRTEGITSYRSAAVLMDGLTGEIAALPSFPVARDHLHPSQRSSRAHLRMLERNSNFVRMVAGSTAKAPLALAILNSFPQLGQLRIPASAPFRVLLGVDLGTPVPDQPGGQWDFRTFLARSSNKYAASLMMFGLSDAQSISTGGCEGPSNESYFIGTQQRNCRPRMSFMEGATQGRFGLQPLRAGRPAGQGWSNNLYTLFCLQPNAPDDQPLAPDLGCIADTPERRAIWRSAQFDRPRLLAAVSPDREGFGLDVVDGIYEDYVMTILGGNRGRWTTISLAQAYARILTGRAITARLTQAGIDPDEEQPQQVRLRVNQGARGQVVDGLRAVVLEGTGRRLASAGLPTSVDGDEIRMFAKTGTPNVAFLGDNARDLLQRFASARCGLRLVQRSPRPGAPPRAELAVGDTPGAPVAAALSARPDCQTRFAGEAAALTELIRGLNGNVSALAQVRADASGQVTEIPPQVQLGEGQGHLLVLMVGRYRAGAPDSEPCSLRTVAINFQARAAADRTPAVSYAISLLQNEATRSWFLGSRCPGPRAPAQPGAAQPSQARPAARPVA